MEKVIIVTGKKKADVDWLASCLDEQGYHSIFCKNTQNLIKNLKKLSIYSVEVLLVVVDVGIWEGIDFNLISELKKCASETPFILLNKNNITFKIEDWLTGPMQDHTVNGFNLSKYFSKSC